MEPSLQVVGWYVVRIALCALVPCLYGALLPWHRVCILAHLRIGICEILETWYLRTDSYVVWWWECKAGSLWDQSVYMELWIHTIWTPSPASFNVMVLLRSSKKKNGGSLSRKRLKLRVSHHSRQGTEQPAGGIVLTAKNPLSSGSPSHGSQLVQSSSMGWLSVLWLQALRRVGCSTQLC